MEGGVYQHGAGKVRSMEINTGELLLRDQLDCSRAVKTLAPPNANDGKGYKDACGDYLPKLKECPAGFIPDPVDELRLARSGVAWRGYLLCQHDRYYSEQQKGREMHLFERWVSRLC